jgi:hypothetical protein
MINVSAADPVIAQNAHYVYFDFHHECKNLRFDRISVLVDQLAPALENMGWFHSVAPTRPASGFTAGAGGEASGSGVKTLHRQTGVVRSNCMDCLDRTNVTQAALGKWALDRQLRAAGVLSHKETIDDHPEFMTIFRHGTLVLAVSTFCSIPPWTASTLLALTKLPA